MTTRTASMLDGIVADTRELVAERKRNVPLEALRGQAAARPGGRSFIAALQLPGVGVIGEIKRGSPSKGEFAPNLAPGGLAMTYAEIGVVAVSVLTPRHFFATDDDLRAAAAALAGSTVPLLRKEFTIDPYQVAEAAALGADSFLAIAKTVDPAALAELIAAGAEWRVEPFVEVTDEAELEAALGAGAPAIGINNRNLHTFREDLGTTERLRDLVPPGVPVVAASGVRTRGDMRRMEDAGVDAVLVGEALSTAADPAAKMRELLGE